MKASNKIVGCDIFVISNSRKGKILTMGDMKLGTEREWAIDCQQLIKKNGSNEKKVLNPQYRLRVEDTVKVHLYVHITY